MRRWPGPALMLAVVAAGCRMDAVSRAPASRLEIRWTGTDTAAFSAPATAEWCDSLHLLDVRAIAGDTGVGLAIYSPDAIAPGTYPVRRPEAAAGTPPSVAVALRWYSKTAVKGFQGTGGRLSLRRAPDGTLAGSFTAKAAAITVRGDLTVVGSFEGLRERPATRGCYTPPPPDTSAGVN